MKKRDELIASIHAFEEAEKTGDRSGTEWQYSPSPKVFYQMDLEYLAQLLQVMHQNYNEEYVWGERTLCKDYIESGEISFSIFEVANVSKYTSVYGFRTSMIRSSYSSNFLGSIHFFIFTDADNDNQHSVFCSFEFIHNSNFGSAKFNF